MKSPLLSRFLLTAIVAALPVALLPLSARDTAPPSSTAIVAAVQPYVDNHNIAGAVMVAANKKDILSIDAVGWADVANKKPMKADTLFWIASQSKPITGAALMILVDEGKVKLDDPIEKYLPEMAELMVKVQKEKGDPVTFEKPSHAVTVREVLSHTSGMPFSTEFEKPTLDVHSLRDRIRSYAKTPLNTQPGTKYAYSNAGINTAGCIVEVVSGMPFEEFLNKRFFTPLGMKDTTFFPNEEQVSRLAKSYRPNGDKTDIEEFPIGQLKYPLTDKSRTSMPAGGLFSTGTDVAIFCQMILNEGEFKGKRYLSKDAVKTLTSKQTGDAVKDNYGLGWSTGGGNIGHGGAHSTNMNIDTNRGLITVWMVQHAGGYGKKDGKDADPQGAFKMALEKNLESKK